MKQDQNSEKLLSRQAARNDDKTIRREGGEVGGEQQGWSQSLSRDTAAEEGRLTNSSVAAYVPVCAGMGRLGGGSDDSQDTLGF